MQVIRVESLEKNYRIHEKQEGLVGSLQGFFHRKYRHVQAVQNLCFAMEQGEIVGFIGPNGAGKTTTLKMLTGLLYPTAGRAEVLGFTPWERKEDITALAQRLMIINHGKMVYDGTLQDIYRWVGSEKIVKVRLAHQPEESFWRLAMRSYCGASA